MYRIRSITTGVAGSPWYTNLYFDEGAGLTATGARDAVVAFWTALQPIMINDVTTSVEAEAARVNYASGEIEGYNSVTAASVVGTQTAAPLPYANQGLITTQTAAVLRSRRVRGRIFVPGLSISAVDATTGTPTGATLTVMSTAAQGLVSATGADLVVWSRPYTAVGITLPGSRYSVTSAAARDFFSVLRSRRD